MSEALAAVARVLEAGAPLDPRSLRASFRLVAADYAELVVLPRLLTALADDAPGVDLTIVTTGDALEDALQRGEADLALGALFRERAGLVHRTLLADPFVCAMREQHPIRRMTLRRYCEARHVLVSPRGLPGGIVDDALEALGRSRRVMLRTPSFQTALALVARSDMIATLPRSMGRAFAELVPLRLVQPPLALPAVRLGMLFAASRRDDPAHRWLRERIAALFA